MPRNRNVTTVPYRSVRANRRPGWHSGSYEDEPEPPPQTDGLQCLLDDDSEFPSLSGTPSQPLQPGAIWGSSGGLRGQNSNPLRQSSGGEASQTSSTIRPPSTSQTQSQRRSEPIEHQSPYAQQLGYGYGSRAQGQGNRHGTSDEFPPLSDGPGRRTGSGQRASPDGLTNGSSRSRIPGQSPSDGFEQQSNMDRVFSPSDAGKRSTPMSARSPLDDSLQRMDSSTLGRPIQGTHGSSNGLSIRTNGEQRWSPLQQNSNDQVEPSGLDAPAENQISEQDRFGLLGLVDVLRGNVGSDRQALGLGHSLDSLGLDLNR